MLNPSLVEDEHIANNQRGIFYFPPYNNPNGMAPPPMFGFEGYNSNFSIANSSKQILQDNNNIISNFGVFPQLPPPRSTVTANLWPCGEEVKSERSMSNNILMKRSLGFEDDKYKQYQHHNIDMGVSSSSTTTTIMKVIKKKAKGGIGRRKMREPRFSFKTMSVDVDVLDDGYKWRKYGQKVVKDTHHPRSYYRCTQYNCRVKKRVERLAEDPRMVITTYEGRHMHSPTPLDNDLDQTLEF